MRGLLFTDFLDMVEAQYSPATADAILTPPGLTSDGVYTAVGVYDYREFNVLVERLVAYLETTRSAILHQFGRFHLHRLLRLYPHLLVGVADTYALLARVNRPIHSTVTDLYPNAELPEVRFELLSPQLAQLTYRSPRALADVADGMICEAVVHYKEQISVERTDLPLPEGHAGEHACFRMSKTQKR